jgi:hypothetical protein
LPLRIEKGSGSGSGCRGSFTQLKQGQQANGQADDDLATTHVRRARERRVCAVWSSQQLCTVDRQVPAARNSFSGRLPMLSVI